MFKWLDVQIVKLTKTINLIALSVKQLDDGTFPSGGIRVSES